MLRTTMSTCLSCSSGSRSFAVMTRKEILPGSPKIACATARAMSMSKPSSLPVNGSRAPKRVGVGRDAHPEVAWSTMRRIVASLMLETFDCRGALGSGS